MKLNQRVVKSWNPPPFLFLCGKCKSVIMIIKINALYYIQSLINYWSRNNGHYKKNKFRRCNLRFDNGTSDIIFAKWKLHMRCFCANQISWSNSVLMKTKGKLYGKKSSLCLVTRRLKFKKKKEKMVMEISVVPPTTRNRQNKIWSAEN